MSAPAVVLDGLSKDYVVHTRPLDAALDFITLGKSRRGTFIPALRDVSLEVMPGQALGIVGPNGSGKSTLLKVVTGITRPSAGRLVVRGHVAGMLELGTGFMGDLTGRENLVNYFRLYHAGENLDKLLERADDFAELGPSLQRVFRTYSSGMQVRLAFAAALAMHPDILVVDEALAVGDAYFQRKCYDHFDSLHQMGTTLLFVSHSPQLLQRYCEFAIYLDQGRVKTRGTSSQVMALYERDVALRRGLSSDQVNGGGQGADYGSKEIRIHSVEICDEAGHPQRVFAPGQIVRVRLRAEAAADYPYAVFSTGLFTDDGVHIFGTNNHHIAPTPLPVRAGDNALEVTMGPLPLQKGEYRLTVAVYTEPQEPFWMTPADYHKQRYDLAVLSPVRSHGMVRMESRWGLTGRSDAEGS